MDVLVRSYNNSDSIRNAVESVLAQERCSVHVWVIDDCSTDGTDEVLEKLKARHPSRLNVLKTSSNLGSAGKAMQEVKFELSSSYWALLDADDAWVYPLKIWEQIQALEEAPDAVGCFGITETVGPDGRLIENISGPQMKWDFLAYFLGLSRPYVHLSSILWRKFSLTPLMISPRDLLAGWPAGEWPRTLAILCLTGGNLVGIDKVVSRYNFSGNGVYSSLSQQQRLDLNDQITSQMRAAAPRSYRVQRILLLARLPGICKIISSVRIRNARRKYGF